MSHSSPFRSPSSGAASISSSRRSVFEDAPVSPSSWKYDTSLVESPRAKLPIRPPVEMRLRACTSPKSASTQMAARKEKSPPRGLPSLPTAPTLKNGSNPRSNSCPSWSQESPFVDHKSSKGRSFSCFSAVESDRIRQEHLDAMHRSMSAFRNQMREPQRAASSASSRTTSSEAKKTKLKVKVTCPNEDDILSIKIYKENIRNVQYLLDAVSVKLNVRYYMRPDDLEFSMRFSDRTLQPVALGADDVAKLMEDFVMDYIHTKSKIYLEARYKPGRDRAPSVCETVTDELVAC